MFLGRQPTDLTSADVNRLIRRLIWPWLREVGFDHRSTRTAWRRWSEGVDVVTFQTFNSYLAAGLGCTTFSFGVNLGTALDYVPDWMEDPTRPQEWECQLRRQLEKTISQPFFRPYQIVSEVPVPPRDRSDIWFVSLDGSTTDASIQDALNVIETDGLPWFESNRDATEVLKRVQTADNDLHFGKPGSPQWCLLVGSAALRNGQLHLARSNLARARDYWADLAQKNSVAPVLSVLKQIDEALSSIN